MVVKRALMTTVTVVTLALPLAACSGTDSADPAAPGSSAAPGGGSSADVAAEVDHTMPAPGPRQPGVLAPADMLVTSGKTIPEATVKAIGKVPGVTGVTVISLSESVIENQALTVAAVDPATYRSFVPQLSSDYQPAWDRLAGGELVLKKRLQDKVPLDDKGYLKLGAADDAAKVHVGAYIDQQPLIDGVVNQTWVKTLGMTPDNALLVRTGTQAPKPIRDEIEKLLGGAESVQLVDKATRSGLDPSALQVAVVTGTVADAVGVYRYTVLGGGHIAPDPAWVASHITTEVVPILGSVTCNKLIFPQLKAALQEVQQRGLADKIHPGEYAGCYYPRFIAGSSTLSNHAFGLALDINTPGNQRGTVGEMDRSVVAIFKEWGFAWGGDWHYTDPMHFEMSQQVSPQGISARK